MTSIELTFVNSQGGILILQVDPWANLYQIEPQQQFSIIAESEKALPRIEIDQLAGSQMIVTLVDSDEFYVLQNGKRLHHLHDFRTNVEGM